MDLHERQQFDFLLYTATERYVERLVQRNEGADNALRRMRDNPNGEGIWLNQFTDAIFQDFLLDNVAGACFVLKALAKKSLNMNINGRLETALPAMAKAVFAELLRQKTEESLEQASGYQAVDMGDQHA